MHMPHHQAASFLFKERRLSQASLELSSSRGVFGSRENKRKRREKREKNKTLTKIRDFIYKIKNLQKFLLPQIVA